MNKDLIGSNCLSMQFELLDGMFFDNKKETDNYVLCTSKTMDDYFWNIVYFKNKINDEIIKETENEFKSINRTPSIYVSRDDKKKYQKIIEYIEIADTEYKKIENLNLDKYVLHGDLHHENILLDGDTYKAIDPHGRIGEKILEVGTFIENEIWNFGEGSEQIRDIICKVAKNMNEDIRTIAISIMNEMIKNEDRKKKGETEEDVKKKSTDEIKQDCELNASKRIIQNFRKNIQDYQ